MNKVLLKELNLCRDNPKKYSLKISKSLKYYQGKVLHFPGCAPMETVEGSGNVNACISYLQGTRPLQALKLSNSLTLAAQAHAQDIGTEGLTGHNSSDGREATERISIYSKWSGSLGENIAFGSLQAEEIIISMLVDDGVLARGHRLNILKRDYNFVGIAFSTHIKYNYVCVIVFAEEIFFDSNSDSVEIPVAIKPSSLQKIKDLEAFEIFEIREYEKKHLPKIQISEIKGVFDYYDNNGVIDFDDIKSVIDNQELEISDLSAFQRLAEHEAPGRKLDFQEFLELMTENSSVTMSVSRTDFGENIEQRSQKPPNKKHNCVRCGLDEFNQSVLTEHDIIEIKEYFDALDSGSSVFFGSEAWKSPVEIRGLEGSNSDIFNVLAELESEDVIGQDFNSLLDKVANKISANRRQPTKAQGRKKPIAKKVDFDPRLYETEHISLENVMEIKEAFDMFDVDNAGTINPLALRHAMETQGLKTRNPTIFRMVCGLDSDGETQVNFEQFIGMMTNQELDDNSVYEVRKLFNIFDIERTGFIELKNLKKIARELGESLNEKELMELFSKSDLDGDGKVSFKDFYEIMNSQTYF